MFDFPNPKAAECRDRKIQRFFEILPGLLTWSTLIGMFVFSFFLPVWVAIFIIVFDLYWIHRSVYIAFYSVYAFRKLKYNQKIDWLERCQYAQNPQEYAKIIRARIDDSKKNLTRKELRIQKDNLKETEKLKNLLAGENEILDWREIIHVVLLPTANESAEVIEPAIEAVKNSTFPNNQIIILLATEEREPEERRLAKVNYLKNKFSGVFRDFIATAHVVADGEMKAKASNATYAAKRIKEYLEARGVDFKKVILSNFDCDTVAHPQYFSALTYHYVTNPKRLQRAYQPIPVYHNNLWDTNALVRVIVTSSSFWHMFQSTRAERMVTFSSHSEPFDTIVKLNYWPVNMISEDSIIYWKGYSYFHGDYQVQPVYLPVSLDAVLAPTKWRTIVNQYKQKRRWAYGIENLPVIFRAIRKDKKIGFFEKIRIIFEMLEGHHSWATAPFILAFLGWLPLILGGNRFNEEVIAHNLPYLTRLLMNLAMFGIIVSVCLSLLLLPPRPKKYSKKRYIYMLLQWFLVPVIAPFLGAMPAIDSQTRLMLGKYFGSFWVTEKYRQ